MLYTELVNKAIDLSYDAHHGQKDKAGRPYFTHPFTVAMSMDTEAEICAALLHDVIEDTNITLDDLREIFPPEVTEAVDVLTHRNSESYYNYIRRIKASPIARKVKLADLAHNMDITRIAGDDNLLAVFEERRKKYEHAKAILAEM
ncbi:MAG: HD domain-containing protein [Synergistaceae bacterium]|nr:HD domain-containing protein [Synergistaceae bacterium]